MNQDVKELLIVTAMLATVISVAICAICLWQPIRCDARWHLSGYATSWSLQGGCLVETSKGRFIPERALRELPQ